MKKVFMAFNVLILVVLFGCADSSKQNKTTIFKPNGEKVVSEAFPLAVSDEQAKTAATCHSNIGKAEVARFNAMMSLPNDQRLLALLGEQMANVVSTALGKSKYDVCKVDDSNYWDYLIADTKEANETRQKFSNGLWGSVPYFMLGWLGYENGKNSGDTVGGNQYKAGRDNMVAGETVYNQGNTNMFRQSEVHQTAVGDENSFGNPVVDQSRNEYVTPLE